MNDVTDAGEEHARSGRDIGHDVYIKLTYLVPCAGFGIDPDCSIVSPHTDHEISYPAGAEIPSDAVGPIGLLEWHRCADGRWSPGGVPFNVPEQRAEDRRPRWTVVSLDPLHLEPSILCGLCGHHGFIRNGAWVPA